MHNTVCLLALFLSSCSFFGGGEGEDGFVYGAKEDDYVDHLGSLLTDYIRSPYVSIVVLDRKSRSYLEDLYWKVVANKSLALDKTIQPRFYIVKDKRVFFFSLPGGGFFFSTGTFDRYFKNEDVLVSALLHEIIKSNRKIYRKRTVVPVGHIETEKMLELTRVSVDIKSKINEWSYFIMQEIQYDPAGILHWIQIQNRNYADFLLQNGKNQKVSEEEARFKQFVVKRGINLGKIDRKNRKSLQGFYHLVNYVKKKSR